jgi:two-component system cell cycle response regulator DivK
MNTILLVEDNGSNMYLITFLLKKNGYNVLQAFTGEEGVQIALKEKIDLILMDIQLPDINGYEATKRIRASKVDYNVPIIALTSFVMAGDEEKALSLGFTGYLTKPIDPATFVQTIEKYLYVEAV